MKYDHKYYEEMSRHVKIKSLRRRVYKDRRGYLFIKVQGEIIEVGYFDGTHPICQDDFYSDEIRLLEYGC